MFELSWTVLSIGPQFYLLPNKSGVQSNLEKILTVILCALGEHLDKHRRLELFEIEFQQMCERGGFT